MLENMFSPYMLGNVEVPNRFAVTAMVTNYCNDDGSLTERFIKYHEEKAKGGYGLIITEDYIVEPHGKAFPGVPGLYKDDQIPKNKEFTDLIHSYGSKIIAQVYHPGSQATQYFNGGVQIVAPSPYPNPGYKEMPRALTVEEIHTLVDQFGDTCLRAKKAGFDGVELHGGHGYLLWQFISPAFNKRTDEYGGPFINRVRIVKELIDNIRSKVGPDYPVILRISAIDGLAGGKPFTESLTLARLLEEWGFTAINVSGGTSVTTDLYAVNMVDMYTTQGYYADMCKKIKQAVNLPIIHANGYNDPFIADTLVAEGVCDFVGMSRQSLADPHLPNKAKCGDYASIRHCIQCTQGCIGGLTYENAPSCLVNPEVGLEYLADYTKPENPKKVMVIGGGLAGMESALIAAKRGHNVTIFEASDQLGGQWRSAAVPPCKTNLNDLLIWEIRELGKEGVEVKFNCEVTEDLIRDFAPDTIVLATGGKTIRPRIKGIDNANVVTAEDVLQARADIKGTVVVCGGGEVGAETAEAVAQRVDKTHIVEMLPEILTTSISKAHIMKILATYGVDIHINTKVLEFTEEGVLAETPDGQCTIPCDYVVLAMGYVSYNPLEEVAKKYCSEVHVAGNARDRADGYAAMKDGYKVGMSI